MPVHFIGRKVKKFLLICIAALSFLFLAAPLQAHASSYTQHITNYDISVTTTWDAETVPEAIDVIMSYSATFKLYYNGSDTDVSFPDMIQIYYGEDLCGTAEKDKTSEVHSDRTQNAEYSVDLKIPLHFSSYDADSKSETIALDFDQFIYSFDDIRLVCENSRYYNNGYIIQNKALINLDAIKEATFSESSSASGKSYNFTVTSSFTSNTIWESDGDSITTYTLPFTVTNTAIPEGKLDLTARKTVNSETPDQSYTFYLLDADGNILQTKQNSTSDGSITFDSIEYDADDIGQTYTYQVKEQAGTDAGITYDSSVYTVSVSLSRKQGDASVIVVDATITKDGEEVSAITFNNTVKREQESTSTDSNATDPDETESTSTDSNATDPDETESNETESSETESNETESNETESSTTDDTSDSGGSSDSDDSDDSAADISGRPSGSQGSGSGGSGGSSGNGSGTGSEDSALADSNDASDTLALAGHGSAAAGIPKTGEPANPVLWVVLLAAAAVLFLGLRKRNQK